MRRYRRSQALSVLTEDKSKISSKEKTKFTGQPLLDIVNLYSKMAKTSAAKTSAATGTSATHHQHLEVAVVVMVSLCFSIAFCYSLLKDLGRAALNNDWAFSMTLAWGVWNSIATFHQIPLWNPYKCGGIPMIGNPQTRILTPMLLLHIIFGPIVGAHLEVPIHMAIGFAGAYVLARKLGLRPMSGIAAGVTFMGSSWFSLHLSEGHTVLLSMVYLPWVCIFVLMAIEQRRLLLGAIAGLTIALIMGEGVHFSAPATALFVAILASSIAVIRRSYWPMIVLGAVGAFGFGFAAIKLLPTSQMLVAHPPFVVILERNTLSQILTALFSRNQNHVQPFIWMWPFHEYGAFVSLPLMGLATSGAVMSYRRALPWTILAVTFFYALVRSVRSLRALGLLA